ncbi:MAG: hypothetical protein JNK04_20520, partial [Myxococcales bacterium]|nr:hypothetical protein [Myxococcales bacterium]
MGFFSQLKRDIKGIFGDKPAPFDKKAPRPAESQKGHRALRVKAIVRETKDAVSVVLEDPTGAPIRFEAGQFFTVIRNVNGKEVRRAYSASSAAHEPNEVRITVKEVVGGQVSPGIVRDLKEGEVLQVAGPSGNFTVPGGRKRLVLLGGGSGITPLIGIARTHLHADPSIRIELVYGNRSEEDIIFKDALVELCAAHPERLRVRHVLEVESPVASRTGKLDRATVLAELDALGAFADEGSMFFVCGPLGMMDETKAALESRKIALSRIKEERFVSPSDATSGGSDAPQTVEVLVQGDRHEVIVKPGLTILEAAQD